MNVLEKPAESTFHPLVREKATSWSGSAFRITKCYEGPISVEVRHVDGTAYIRAGGVNFTKKGEYYIGGHIVSVRFGLDLNLGAEFKKDGVTLNPVWGGVKNARRIIDIGSRDALVEIDQGDTLTIYYHDGRVAKANIHGDGESCLHEMCDPSEALNLRLSLIGGRFDKAFEKNDVRTLDAQFHELASLLRFTAFYPVLRDKIASTIGSLTKKRGGTPLNEGVRIGLLQSLAAIDDHKDYWWLSKVTEAPAKPVAVREEEAPARKHHPVIVDERVDDGTPPRGLLRSLHEAVDAAIATPGDSSAYTPNWEYAFNRIKHAGEKGWLTRNIQHKFCLNAPNDLGWTDVVGKLPVADRGPRFQPRMRTNRKQLTPHEKKLREKARDDRRKARDAASRAGTVKKEKKEGQEGNNKNK